TWVHVDTPGDYNFVYSYGQPGCDTSDAVTITFNVQPVVQGHLITPNNTVVIYGYQGTNSIYPHDSLVVSSSAFSMITDTGEYFFKVSYQNLQSMYPDIYYDNTFFWQLAQPVQMTCGDTAYLSIYFQSIVVNSSGNGQLHGHIYFENSLLPFRNASVFLVDSISGEIINYTLSDTNGNYSFYNVPDGHYYFTVDIFSLKQISTHYIFLTPGNNILTYLDFKIDTFINTRNSYGIYAVNGQNGISSNETIPISIFPTLSTGIIFIESTQEKITGIEIRNITGKTLKKLNTQSNRYQINLENQPSGIYFITVRTQKSSFVRKVVLINGKQ
ncbi:MAG: T9SS type A sorting domain-containing protein, partial [Bacteroidales bacterium]|nr:T9SS type A sorting domain-containing protein [Bacteroidales bacterium]